MHKYDKIVHNIILYKTMQKVTATQLKQNTRKVIQMIQAKPSEPAVVYSHDEPLVVIISYDQWQKMIPPKQPRFEEIKHLVVRSQGGKKIDSAATIRKWRDEE